MATRPEVRIGIVGYGTMGRAHNYGYRAAPVLTELAATPRVVVISGREEAAVKAAAARYDIPQWTTDWRELVRRPDIDVVDICTPPGTHALPDTVLLLKARRRRAYRTFLHR